MDAAKIVEKAKLVEAREADRNPEFDHFTITMLL